MRSNNRERRIEREETSRLFATAARARRVSRRFSETREDKESERKPGSVISCETAVIYLGSLLPSTSSGSKSKLVKD
jgi:hypothetical protein